MMEHYWNPKLSVDNVHGDPKQTIKYTLMKNMLGEALVCERRTIKATFIENLELHEFPFDTQVSIHPLYSVTYPKLLVFLLRWGGGRGVEEEEEEKEEQQMSKKNMYSAQNSVATQQCCYLILLELHVEHVMTYSCTRLPMIMQFLIGSFVYSYRTWP